MTQAIRLYHARTIPGQSISDGTTLDRISLPCEPWETPAPPRTRKVEQTDTTQDRALAILRSGPATTKEIALQMVHNANAVRKALARLENRGIVARDHKGNAHRAGKWRLK
jgi:predicted Rossmann fold nucleotide-binding protein DprA/Smf involved in DNA uptake